jgi:urease accessory protein
MVAPVNSTPLCSGHASLEVELVCCESTITSALAASPMKLLTPRSRGPSVWAYSSSFGGGLVAGDQTRLELQIGRSARCFFGTQASTKVYRNPGRLPCGHETHATLAASSLLVFAPDPVQAFAESRYTQRQEFHIAADASLILVDWLSSGRSACGERWAFSHLATGNEVFVEAERIFLDSVRLHPGDGDFASPHRGGRFNCIGLVLLIGPLVSDIATQLLQDIATHPIARRASVVSSASPLRNGALLRFAGEQVEAIGREVHRHLGPVRDLLGDDPWSRKW